MDDLLKNYDRRMIPTYQQPGTPTMVSCEFLIRSISAVDPITMDYEVDLYLRQSWNDQRLCSANLTRALDLSDPKLVQAIWKPEVFFANAKHAAFQYVTVPNVMLRIYPNGNILYMLRLKMTFACMMDLSKYPFDMQICTMEMASFSKTTNELILTWASSNPVQLTETLKLPQYEIKDVKMLTCNATFHIGEFSCIVAEFHLQRSIGFHLLESYLPTILIVIISWLSFWLDVEATPARITLGITTLLTMSFKGSSFQETLPQVSYVKAIDVWMGCCTAFVFAAVLEFTFVNYMCRKQSARHYASVNGTTLKCSTEKLHNEDNCSQEEPECETKENNNVSTINQFYARQFDSISRVAFPVGFLMFNLFYWPYFMYYK